MSTGTPSKEQILALLRAWIKQRPGLEFGNYGDVSAYRSELRRITRQRHDAETLLGAVERAHSLTAERLIAGFRAYSGRLSLVERGGNWTLDYCTGQYWPTEYRAAACAVLASALWDYRRDECMPTPETVATPYGEDRRYNGKTAGDFLRHSFRREFGAHMQRRWFD